MDLSKFSLSLNKKIIKYCQDIKHRLRNKEFGYIEVFPIHYIQVCCFHFIFCSEDTDDHQTTGNQKRKPTDTTSERNQQRQTREYQTAEQNTSIKVKYCKTKHRLRNKEFGYIEVFPIHYIQVCCFHFIFCCCFKSFPSEL
jgi:hypothetical protein